MVFPDTAESLKAQYTDKYVKVDPARPELARFRDVVGQVKTVNMNGRALVEFQDYHLNIGWYDIDLSCLTVVDKPAPKAAAEKHAEPKAAAKPAAAKPAAPAAGEKKLSPLELARMQGAGGAKPAGGAEPASGVAPAKKSTADILAAARGGAAAAPAAKPASGEAKPAGAKPSTADILAAARGGKPAAAPAPAAPTPPKAEAPAAPAPSPAPAAEPASGGIVRVDKSSMTVQQMIEYCRAKDSQ